MVDTRLRPCARYILVFYIFLGRLALVCATTCYYPAGDEAPVDIVCNPLAENSACCGPGYACLGNGLCQRTAEATDGNGVVFNRGSCTDPTFASPACPKFCNSAGTNREGGSAVLQCSDPNVFCCAGTGCDCDTNRGVTRLPGGLATITVIDNPDATTTLSYSPLVPSTSTSAASSSAASSTLTTALSSSTTSSMSSALVSTSTASLTASAAPTGGSAASNAVPTASPTPNDQSLKLGLGLGIPLGVLVLAGLAGTFWWLGRSRSQRDQFRPTSLAHESMSGYPAQSPPQYQVGTHPSVSASHFNPMELSTAAPKQSSHNELSADPMSPMTRHRSYR